MIDAQIVWGETMNVKYVCKKCGDVGHYKWYEKMSGFIIAIFFALGISSSLFVGYGMVKLGPDALFSQTVSFTMFLQAAKPDSEIRSLGAGLIHDCTEGDRDCYIQKVHKYMMDNFTYVLPATTREVYTPEEIVKMKNGDCKNFAILETSILTNIGVFSRVDCNQNLKDGNRTVGHCIVIADGDYNRYRLDPTWKTAEVISRYNYTMWWN
jgi:hypothetical protein